MKLYVRGRAFEMEVSLKGIVLKSFKILLLYVFLITYIALRYDEFNNNIVSISRKHNTKKSVSTFYKIEDSQNVYFCDELCLKL